MRRLLLLGLVLLLPRGNFAQNLTIQNNTSVELTLNLELYSDAGQDNDIESTYDLLAGQSGTIDLTTLLSQYVGEVQSTYGDTVSSASDMAFNWSDNDGGNLGNTAVVPLVTGGTFSLNGQPGAISMTVPEPSGFQMGALFIVMASLARRRCLVLPLSRLTRRLVLRWRSARCCWSPSLLAVLWAGEAAMKRMSSSSGRGRLRYAINNFRMASMKLADGMQKTMKNMKRIGLALLALAAPLAANAQSTNVTTDVSVLYTGIVTPFNTALGIGLAITGTLLVIFFVKKGVKMRG